MSELTVMVVLVCGVKRGEQERERTAGVVSVQSGGKGLSLAEGAVQYRRGERAAKKAVEEGSRTKRTRGEWR